MKKSFIIILLAITLFTLIACSNNKTTPEPSFDTTKHITVVAREDGSGTKSAFMEIIGLKGKNDPTGAIIQNGTAGVLAEVAGNPAAIAYESLGYITKDVKMVNIDGIEPTIDNIKNGTYLISRPLSIVYKEEVLTTPINQAFFDYIGSVAAQKIITDNGYVSLSNNPSEYNIDGSLTGSIEISGSTSLFPLMSELAIEFEKLQGNIKVNVSGGGSGTGYKNAQEGVSVFGMISEEYDNDKAQSTTHYTVCKDGIAIIVNSSNPLTNIKMEELKNIYNAESTESAINIWNQLWK